jgi:hypothetical protein
VEKPALKWYNGDANLIGDEIWFQRYISVIISDQLAAYEKDRAYF